MKIEISDSVREQMEERGIQEEDVQQVVDGAEADGVYLYQDDDENHRLAKRVIGGFTVYAEYTAAGDSCELQNGYSHHVSLSEN